MTSPLHGVRVLDLSRVIAGPVCTLQLADLGAEVIKVEHPGHGDEARGMGPPSAGGESHFFLAFNRNKKSVALDITIPAGRDALHALAAKSDVLVENFRPGVMARLGLDWDTMAARHPHLVYCAISAYGRTSPLADRAGFDPDNAHAAAVPVGLFKTKSRPLYLAGGTDRIFDKLCRAVLGRPDLAGDPRFSSNAARSANREGLFAILDAIFAGDTAEAWCERLLAAGVPAGQVRTVAEGLESDEVRARRMVVSVAHAGAGDLRLLGSPYKLSATPVVEPAAPPRLGEHTAEVLREVAGLDEERIAALREGSAIPGA